MLTPNFFTTVFVFPILNLLILFYHVFLFVKVPGAFGFAIIALTVVVRLLLQPFFRQQMHTAKKMQDIKPHLDRLSEKHKGDKQRIQQEQLKLYQQAGINPASGCLFLIIQIPIFIALYNTLLLFFVNGKGAKLIQEVNNVLYSPFLKIQSINPLFYGFNLALSPQKSGVWYYYLLPAVTAFLQYYQVKISTPQTPKKTDTVPLLTDSVQGKEKKESSQENFQQAMNTQMKFIFPILIGWFSYTLPVGLSLYWNIFSIFSIIQYNNLKTKSTDVKS